MIKRRVIISIFLILLQVWIVSARTVEYEYYMTNYEFKNYQQFWKIETNDDVSFEDVNYLLHANFNWSTIIPKYTNLEEKIIDRFWFKGINKLVNVGYIKIWWINFRFINPIEKQTWPWTQFKEIILEDKEVLNTNLKHERIIRINSEKDQNIKLKLYSVSPDTYSVIFSRDDLVYPWNYWIPDENTIITLYDTTQEYYNLSWYSKSNMTSLENWHSISDDEWLKIRKNNELNIQKKYELINFKRKTQYQKDWISKSYIPYYEISFDVSKWENDLHLTYESYQFPNQPLQIK